MPAATKQHREEQIATRSTSSVPKDLFDPQKLAALSSAAPVMNRGAFKQPARSFKDTPTKAQSCDEAILRAARPERQRTRHNSNMFGSSGPTANKTPLQGSPPAPVWREDQRPTLLDAQSQIVNEDSKMKSVHLDGNTKHRGKSVDMLKQKDLEQIREALPASDNAKPQRSAAYAPSVDSEPKITHLYRLIDNLKAQQKPTRTMTERATFLAQLHRTLLDMHDLLEATSRFAPRARTYCCRSGRLQQSLATVSAAKAGQEG